MKYLIIILFIPFQASAHLLTGLPGLKPASKNVAGLGLQQKDVGGEVIISVEHYFYKFNTPYDKNPVHVLSLGVGFNSNGKPSLVVSPLDFPLTDRLTLSPKVTFESSKAVNTAISLGYAF